MYGFVKIGTKIFVSVLGEEELQKRWERVQQWWKLKESLKITRKKHHLQVNACFARNGFSQWTSILSLSSFSLCDFFFLIRNKNDSNFEREGSYKEEDFLESYPIFQFHFIRTSFWFQNQPLLQTRFLKTQSFTTQSSINHKATPFHPIVQFLLYHYYKSILSYILYEILFSKLFIFITSSD